MSSILPTIDERDKTVLHLCRQKKFMTAAKHIQNWIVLEEFEIQRRIDEAIETIFEDDKNV